ncbi:hypothetical protein CDL15_Pgr010360 [Punica granatum]|uniref:NAD(P)H dehydrogenase (quinone) n=1 Tax=Punica granatum TaxID=22663 RepID=A0A218W2G0_PUNGR|nr:hypothetical protein CDL15_Pgr010360 [Punica granatum]
MRAPAKANDVAEISPEQLLEADGFIFGFPSRFGVMAAQFKAFFDATHHICETQALAGKPAGIFWSTGFHGGGQELTALTAVTQLAHHGMLFVPLGYTFGSGMFEMNEVKGGSSYGAGTFAADGSREPTELELKQAFHQELRNGEPVAIGDVPSPEPGRVQRDRVLVKPREGRVADEARGLHQDVAPPVVRTEAGEAPVVQGPQSDPLLGPARRHPGLQLPHRQGRRGRPQQALRFRGVHEPGHYVLHR